eukprot:g81922.t1
MRRGQSGKSEAVVVGRTKESWLGTEVDTEDKSQAGKDESGEKQQDLKKKTGSGEKEAKGVADTRRLSVGNVKW